ncbi:MAG: T9SS type A sorting domain-containing protein [Bacteroidetes bacterium]|nr:T9SS type A sorting domain-containing protein [Bacteroidota bacterium]MBP7399620.1 T9SS type A sorting domain-containing protein [Chitinophagales bacterium]MBK7108221.1 T9SS type A sorting domain-containing protein [Bacteroidota bacterium]MBP8754062.1 T9SS type A sorting domain-containing protein [Chitinophagales bacterium]MBP9189871.1 T9SS type A sorting domain-containing protein [Chitinophagales bacterium]
MLLCVNQFSFAQDIDTLDWEEILVLSDTVYTDGLDTLYLIDDSISETFRTGTSTECLYESSPISINLNSTIKNINQGQYGINVGKMFTQSHLYDDIYSDEQWQWLSDLKPKSLRFPGGSSSKFMHLLNGDKGYGYDIVELIRYYDSSDDFLDIDTDIPSEINSILNEFDFHAFEEWMKPELSEQFYNLKKDYVAQEELTSDDLYIDHFIRLIKQIETDNPGHTIDVIVCLNILTENAADCKAIVNYLRNVTVNSENYPVNVVGVEMGNEVANKFHALVMKFNDFDDYWKYLDGQNVTSQINHESALGEPLFIPAADRNFFSVFKNSGGFNCKIGLCAGGLDISGSVFLTDPEDVVASRPVIAWNTDLANHYSDKHPGSKIKKFHAVILHTYYAENEWYDECVIGPDIINPFLESSYTCPEWDYHDEDERIQPAFDAVRLNFRNFMNNRYDYSFNAYKTQLKFNLTSTDKKDMWITEWNFKDEGVDDKGRVFTNGFMHGILLQEWWLKNMKLNFASGFRENFFTYSTVQNYAGGSESTLLTPASKLELDILGKNFSPYNLPSYDLDKRNYFVRRTTFFIMDLLSEINKNNLNYFPATQATVTGNLNMFPTFFIDPAKENIYMYYTNTRCMDQKYILNPANMYSLFGSTVTLNNATIYAVDAYQAYSTAGKSTLYDINGCYDPETNPYTIEIDQTYSYSNPGCDATTGSFCVIVPGYTVGYVKIQVHHLPLRLAEETNYKTDIFPNPAINTLNINSKKEINQFEIYSITGACLASGNYNQTLDISFLSQGMYQLVLTCVDGEKSTHSFIKL